MFTSRLWFLTILTALLATPLFAQAPPDRLTVKPAQPAAPIPKVPVGESVQTSATQQRAVRLDNQTTLFVNRQTTLKHSAPGEITLIAGEILVDTAAPLTIKAGPRNIEMDNAQAAVRLDPAATVLVTRGQVTVAGWEKPVRAGYVLLATGANKPTPMPRASHVLSWTKNLMAAAAWPLVPGSQFNGGALIAKDPNGQETKISLRKFHVDVHIEDGFARTTIDQTYFNQEPFQLEGTFYFPLPADASLSRLAMYVDGALMEGGMAERDLARNVYETIRYTNRDPALLEWVDGTTFKMRVFPLEPRTEKRIVLSYTQRLPSLYGQVSYRFPAGDSKQKVKEWSFEARVKGGARLAWTCQTHTLKDSQKGGDLVLKAAAKDAVADRDVALTFAPVANAPGSPRFSSCTHEGSRYLMMRYTPDLKISNLQSKIKNPLWVFLFESSGDRDPLLGRAQIDVIRNFLTHVDPGDRFMVAAAGTRVKFFEAEPQLASPENIQKALAFLEQSHLIGALDLGNALDFIVSRSPAQQDGETYLVHVGSGIAAMGERREASFVKKIEGHARYVGVGVGRRWNRAFMKAAADKTGGHFTQINPDEPIAWRAFDLFATLQTPRLVVAGVSPADFLVFNQSIAQGEELCAVTRVSPNALPKSLVIRGLLDGKPVEYQVPVKDVAGQADYLPRTWAKLEIDRLLADDALKHKDRIVALSKAMYVMTPFTSLLVLENEDLYTQYKVDRGRKDHWAIYACPQKIPVVYEPAAGEPDPKALREGWKQRAAYVAKTVVNRSQPNLFAAKRSEDWRIGQNISTPLGFRLEKSYKDIILDVRETQNGSLMFGAGLNSDSGLVGSIAVNGANYLNHVPMYNVPVLSKIPYLSTLENYRQFVKQGRYAEALSAARKAKEIDPDSLAADAAIQIINMRLAEKEFDGKDSASRDSFIRRELTPSEGRLIVPPASPEAIFGLGLNSQFELAGSVVTSSFDLKQRPPSRIGQILVVGNEVNSDRVIRRVIGIYPGQALQYPELRVAEKDLSRLGLFDDSNSAISSVGLYQRPGFSAQDNIFFDLLTYAPGMNSSQADLEAVLEAEALPSPFNKPGQIDPGARDLLDKARLNGWHTWTIPSEKGQPGIKITFDGAGRYAYHTSSPLGIKERVICDGQTLVHLYPQLFVGAKRTVSRFHRDDFAALVPWYLPPAEDLAHGVDLKMIGNRTVALVPQFEAKLRKKTKELKGVSWLRQYLVFGTDGKLAERQIIKMPGQTILARQILDEDGTVRLLDKENKEVAVRKGKLAQAKEPQDLQSLGGGWSVEGGGKRQPSTRNQDFGNLVVLPLPYRTAEHLQRTLKIDKKGLAELRLAEALPLLAAHVGAGNGAEAEKVFRQCFHAREQRQLGYYVLLAACGVNLDSQNADVLAEHLDEPLAQYLALHSSPVLRKHASQWALASVTWNEGFLQHLTLTHALYQRWQDANVTKGDPARVRADRQKALAYVRANKDTAFGFALLCLMQDRAGKDQDFHRELAEAWRLFEDNPALSYVARYEFARSLAKSGQAQEARKHFQELYVKTFKEESLPAIDSDFRWALVGDDGQAWTKLMQDTAAQLIQQKHRPAVLALAHQVWGLGDEPLANTLLNTALEGIENAKDKTALTLAGIDFLEETNQIAAADDKLRSLAADKELAKQPGLWRLGLRFADKRDAPDRALEFLEKALESEFAKLPEVVGLNPVRADYGRLLEQYEKLADAMVILKVKPGPDFLAKVVRAADRWRALDRDSADPSTKAASILQRLGERELGWDYLTTPVALKPTEAEPWVGMAVMLARKGDLVLAERAYKAATEAEPTNAQFLWDRAQNLRRAGNRLEAQAIYRQIAEGKWQPRFQGLVHQARQLLD